MDRRIVIATVLLALVLSAFIGAGLERRRARRDRRQGRT